MELNRDGQRTDSLVRARIESKEDGKGRKYYWTALLPTTEVTVRCRCKHLSYNASTGIVKGTTRYRRLLNRHGVVVILKYERNRRQYRDFLLHWAAIPGSLTKLERLWHAECNTRLPNA